MDVQVNADAAELVREQGGTLWVWAARPWGCCWGTPATMHAETEQPPDLSGFRLVCRDGIDVWFRPVGDHAPDVLEIGVWGKRKRRVEAYWDGLRMAT